MASAARLRPPQIRRFSSFNQQAQRCFWACAAPQLIHDTQAEILRWLALLSRHFAAASLSVPLTAPPLASNGLHPV